MPKLIYIFNKNNSGKIQIIFDIVNWLFCIFPKYINIIWTHLDFSQFQRAIYNSSWTILVLISFHLLSSNLSKVSTRNWICRRKRYYVIYINYYPLCSNTTMEFKNNSVPLKPKTEFKFNRKEYKKITKKIFERSNFSKNEIENFSTT